MTASKPFRESGVRDPVMAATYAVLLLLNKYSIFWGQPLTEAFQLNSTLFSRISA